MDNVRLEQLCPPQPRRIGDMTGQYACKYRVPSGLRARMTRFGLADLAGCG